MPLAVLFIAILVLDPLLKYCVTLPDPLGLKNYIPDALPPFTKVPPGS